MRVRISKDQSRLISDIASSLTTLKNGYSIFNTFPATNESLIFSQSLLRTINQLCILYACFRFLSNLRSQILSTMRGISNHQTYLSSSNSSIALSSFPRSNPEFVRAFCQNAQTCLVHFQSTYRLYKLIFNHQSIDVFNYPVFPSYDVQSQVFPPTLPISNQMSTQRFQFFIPTSNRHCPAVTSCLTFQISNLNRRFPAVLSSIMVFPSFV